MYKGRISRPFLEDEMPFKSEAQRKYFHKFLPEHAAQWEAETPKGKKLPKRVKKKTTRKKPARKK